MTWSRSFVAGVPPVRSKAARRAPGSAREELTRDEAARPLPISRDQPPPVPGRRGFWLSRSAAALLLFLLLAPALAAPAALVGMIYGIIQRPLTGVIASVVVLLTAYRNRQLIRDESDAYMGRLLYSGIGAGMAGEALTYLVFSVPPGAPTSPPWVNLFSVAIGGAIGLGFGLAGLMLTIGLMAARLIPTLARDVFSREP